MADGTLSKEQRLLDLYEKAFGGFGGNIVKDGSAHRQYLNLSAKTGWRVKCGFEGPSIVRAHDAGVVLTMHKIASRQNTRQSSRRIFSQACAPNGGRKPPDSASKKEEFRAFVAKRRAAMGHPK